MSANIAECEAAGLDAKKVEAIARRLSRAARDAQALGLVVFGGSGSGSLRFNDGGDGSLIVAEIDDGIWDGGDGGDNPHSPDGLRRGESA